MNKDPFKDYIKESEPGKRDKGYAWHTAIGMQAVDGLKTSDYLVRTAVRNIEGEISFEEANALLQAYYEEQIFLRNLLLNENHPLHNRTIHISRAFKERTELDIKTENTDIETGKPDIEMEEADIETVNPDIGKIKADIEKKFQPKTAGHILKLWEAFPGQTIFVCSDVMEVMDVKPSRASELLRDMKEQGIIEPVSGHGKGKYRFRERLK